MIVKRNKHIDIKLTLWVNTKPHLVELNDKVDYFFTNQTMRGYQSQR